MEKKNIDTDNMKIPMDDQATEMAKDSQDDDLLGITEITIEEVAIDGICGVY